MRVLHVSKFLHHVGGVETYLRWVTNALAAQGHEVGLLGMQPPPGDQLMDLPDGPRWLTPNRSYARGRGQVRSAATSIWSVSAEKVMREALETFRPDVVHFHGTCYQLTPSVVHATTRAGAGIVLTAHEYKLICANQTLYDDAERSLCTECVGTSLPRKLVAPNRRACIKGSRAATLIGAVEGQVSIPVWRRAEPTILAPSHYMRQALVTDGWSPAQVEYLDLPWRREDEDVRVSTERERDSIVFPARLAWLKGPDILVRAWAQIAERHPGVRLLMLGHGEATEEVGRLVDSLAAPRVELVGRVDQAGMRAAYDRALVTAHPSQSAENSPYSVRESLMAGVPAVVSEVGGVPEMVSRWTGTAVGRRDVEGWAAALESFLVRPSVGSPELRAEVRERATTEEAHLDVLDRTYERTARRSASTGP